MNTAFRKRLLLLTHAAMIAAVYLLLTYVAFMLGLDKGVIQLRFSEMLCALCAFTPAAVPGLGVGCLLANILTGSHPLDVIFGTLATLLGALGGRLLCRAAEGRGPIPALVTLPTVIANAAIIPLLLTFVYGAEEAYFFLLATVTVGELLSATVLGTVLLLILRRYRERLFRL